MPVVVSDTSPVRALAHLNVLPVLPALFGRVLIPPIVQRELAYPPSGMVAVRVDDLPFVDIRGVAGRDRLERLLLHLDAGEAEALALAVEVGANLVLIDEAAGRAEAKALGLRYTGTL